MDVRKTVIALVVLLSISQGASGSSAMSALRTWRHGSTSPQQELNQQLQQAAQHVNTAGVIESALESAHAAISQGDLLLYNQRKEQLLKLIKRNPDTLWHKARWDGLQERYLIDSVTRIDLVDNARTASAIQSAEQYRKFVDTISDTYTHCLALSNRPILSPSAKKSYLEQLAERYSNSVKNFEHYIKLAKTLLYLGDIERCNVFNKATVDTLPRDIRGLIASFCLGQTPKSEQKLEDRAHLIKMRKVARASNEADTILENILDKVLALEPPQPQAWDRTVMRALVRSGLAQNDLLSQSEACRERTVLRIRNYHCIEGILPPLIGSAVWFANFALSLNDYLHHRPILHFPYYGTSSFLLGSGALTLFFSKYVLLALREYKKEVTQAKAKFKAQNKILHAHWKDIARTVNETRFSFEKGIENLPDVISVPSVAQENGFELE